MVKLDPAALPMPSLTQPLQPSDPLQSFEAILAEAEQALAPPTAGFGELGMLGRHAATAMPALFSTPSGEAVQAVGYPPPPTRTDMRLASSAETSSIIPLAPTVSQPAADLPARVGAVIQAHLSLARTPAAALPISRRPPEPALSSSPARSAAARAARRALPQDNSPAQTSTRVEVAGPGNALRIAIVGPVVGEEGRGRLRRLLAEVAADLGLHLAEFSLNGQTVAPPGVGALGGFHGRIRG